MSQATWSSWDGPDIAVVKRCTIHRRVQKYLCLIQTILASVVMELHQFSTVPATSIYLQIQIGNFPDWYQPSKGHHLSAQEHRKGTSSLLSGVVMSKCSSSKSHNTTFITRSFRSTQPLPQYWPVRDSSHKSTGVDNRGSGGILSICTDMAWATLSFQDAILPCFGTITSMKLYSSVIRLAFKSSRLEPALLHPLTNCSMFI